MFALAICVDLFNMFVIYKNETMKLVRLNLLHDFSKQQCLFIPGHAGLSNSYQEVGLHYDSTAGASNKLLKKWKPEYDNLPDSPFHLDIAGNLVNKSSRYTKVSKAIDI